MEIILPILLIIFFVLVFSVGLTRTMQILPALIIFGLLFFFFGWVIVNFFWVFLIIWVIKNLLGPTPQRKNTRYYKTYTGKEAEDFFKQFYGQNGYSQNGNYNNNNYQGNYNSWNVNRDEYYAELGVKEGCTKEELRKAYLKKVKENHPDRFANVAQKEKEYHEEKLKKINEAYDNLMKDFS